MADLLFLAGFVDIQLVTYGKFPSSVRTSKSNL